LRHTIDSSERIHKFPNFVQLEWKAVFQVLDEQDKYRTARPKIRPVSLVLAVQAPILKTVKPARCSLLYSLAELFLVG
jgi:hypothetical protein